MTGDSLVSMLAMSRDEPSTAGVLVPAAGAPSSGSCGLRGGGVGGACPTFLLQVTEGCGKDMNCLRLALGPAARKDFCVYLHFSEQQSLCSHVLGHFVGKLSSWWVTWRFLSLPQIPPCCLSVLPWTYLG